MKNEIFVLSLALFFALALSWGFKNLPKEKWQILLSRPVQKQEDGSWIGENLTYYGFFTATAYLIAVIILIVLLGSLRIPFFTIFALTGSVIGICLPASKVIAKIVEKKSHTFTVGGAAFAGILVTPWIIRIFNLMPGKESLGEIEVMTVLAAVCIAYSLGEGFGRLACISFGCCYGKVLSQCHPCLKKLFEKRHFIFSGKTKKIAYAHGLDGKEVIPVQAVTAVIYCTSGLIGIYLFLKGSCIAAFLETLAITQIWRIVSEFFRADYRGEGKVSAYQIMGGLAVLYGLTLPFIFPMSEAETADVLTGLAYLWNPGAIIFLQCLWLGIFLYNGRSKVTGSCLSFHVIRERI